MNLEYLNITFLINNDSLIWITLIIQILSPFSIITLTLFYCCSKKIGGKNGVGKSENLQGSGGTPGSAGSCGGGSSVGAKVSDHAVEDVIKTDKTQEETEFTQEITGDAGNNGGDGNYEISPYPFEMFHRGFATKKKKKHHKHSQQQQQQQHGGHDRPKGSGTKRSRQQQQQQLQQPQPSRTSRRNQQQQIQKLPNEMDSISQTQTTQPRQHPASEVVSKPMSQKEKIPFKEKSLAKPSLDLPLGSDATQSTVCSTQPSCLQTDILNNNNNGENKNS